ncbi:MAG: cellulase [Verrucomicrobia bacterium]|nr:cellulase [Verrucomicrobiota bacterium]
MANDSSFPKLGKKSLQNLTHVLPITMWDFSWLERRWPGAGYEDIDVALDELCERGYRAVRIDAYPHLLAADPQKEWELLPEWTTNDWGAPGRCRVEILRPLIDFISACKDRNVWVGLSTWFRQDIHNHRLRVVSPKAHAEIWLSVLDAIQSAGLLDSILFVDLCNEWPIDCWAPFYISNDRAWESPASFAWQKEACDYIRERYPQISLTFSSSCSPNPSVLQSNPEFLDFLEPHFWMTTVSDFYKRIDYTYQRFDLSGYERLVLHGEYLYRADPAHWQGTLTSAIDKFADWSRRVGKPLITTECWGVVDFKDWPLLDWGWVKELCALGTETALATGQWHSMATSNFCGPQFRGMWRDVEWHLNLTKKMTSTSIDAQ